jgi:gamma-glutamylcyclotransferase (GGCT)/AIG2-like uncharacterized protein YtfP
MTQNSYLFVYGSLRKGFHNEAYNYISEYFTWVGNAKVRGTLHDLGAYPAAIPSSYDTYIIGELYKLENLDQHDWAFAQLDDYEGVHVETGEVPEYKRELATVYIENNEITSWIYWFNGNIANLPIIESGDVMDYVKTKQQK